MAEGPNPPSAAAPRRRERVFTWPLVTFLLAVATFDLVAWWRRSVLPGPAEAIELLADGDLDGDERRRVLRGLVDAGRGSTVVVEQWGALLAAIALDDRAAHEALRTALAGPGTTAKLPPLADRELLHLGDPLLANVFAASVAEAEGNRAVAVLEWQQVATQCQLMHRPFAAELAADALRRLR